MAERYGEIGRYETDRAGSASLWRIRHPDHAYYVAFIGDGDGDRVQREHLRLVFRLDGSPPPEALQFGRRRDAGQFAQAFLIPEIPWIFEPSVAPAPALWSESAPPDHLLEAFQRELAEESLRP